MTSFETSIILGYQTLVDAGEIDHDPAQHRIAGALDKLRNDLANQRLARKSSSLGWMFARSKKTAPVEGLYIHGGVGRGKTMLMDLFFQSLPDIPKRRVHFHEFMNETHNRIHEWRQKSKRGEVQGNDPIAPVAKIIAAEASTLCFDEFQVNDITDAMLLGRLFSKLFELHVTIVATSNTEPDDLYKDGLNRGLFLPFIDMIKQRLQVVRLDSRADYRLDKVNGIPVYFLPPEERAEKSMDIAWKRWSPNGSGAAGELTVKGRQIKVPEMVEGAARFGFSDLCELPLGAGDYLEIAHKFHTVFIDNIPVFGPAQRNEVRRFINLIDALYDNNVRLVVSAAAEPASLYVEGDGADSFMRTASRLIEMRSQAYLAAADG
ncbi:MAG: AFG1 family ATPase [Rhizobiales bacterium]|nr:AFG1 family ATPase [Hyphomicrobiales bacterium]